jgi:hypothetical protein
MTETGTRGYLLDTTALIRIATSRQVSTLIVTAPHFHLPIYAPVACVDAADRIRPGIARHIGRIPTIEPTDLTYGAVLDGRERTPELPLPVAQVVSLARPSPDWSAGLIVATAQSDLYQAFDLPIYPIGD